MKKSSLVLGFLFAAANVFGMYNNEAIGEKNTNPKRFISYDQEFIPCKKHITSVDVFEKSSANKLKRRNSDDMEVDRDVQEGRIIKKNAPNCLHVRMESDYTFGLSKMDKENPPKIKSCIIDAIIPGYLHIIHRCHSNMTAEELGNLDATLAENFDKIKSLLTDKSLPHTSDEVFVVDIATYSMIENPLMNRIYTYTEAISKLLFLGDDQKHRINDTLTELANKSVNDLGIRIDSRIRACFEQIVVPGQPIRNSATYQVKY